MTGKFVIFIIFLVDVALVYAFGGQFGPGEWYAEIRKPSWGPPGRVFGTAWLFLYLLIAVAAWQIWLCDHRLNRRALTWWVVQLILSGVWPWLFFGLHRTGWALAEMALFISTIMITVRLFRRISPGAATLMIPMVAWASYLWVLNFAVWWMNGGGLGSILD